MVYRTKAKYKRKSCKGRRRIKAQKPIFKSRVFWDIVLGIVLIGSLGYLIFFSPLLKVNLLSEADIFSIWGVDEVKLFSFLKAEPKNLLLLWLRGKSLEEKIMAQFPVVKSADFDKHQLVLTLEAREPVFAFYAAADDTACQLVDRAGVMFSCGLHQYWQKRAEELLKVVSVKPMVTVEEIEKILKIEKQTERLDIAVEKFVLASQSQLDVETQAGWRLLFDLASDIDLALTKLTLLLEKEIAPAQLKNLEYIDLRFTKVYYK